MIPIHCQICEERIAMADPKDLSVPIHGNMFVSPYPERMPEPIIQPTEWEFIRCPFCQTRPFIRNDEVLTENGVIYRISAPSEDADEPEGEASDVQIEPIDTFKTVFPCECCDPPKEFDIESKRDQHTRMIKRWAKKRKGNNAK